MGRVVVHEFFIKDYWPFCCKGVTYLRAYSDGTWAYVRGHGDKCPNKPNKVEVVEMTSKGGGQ